jgi:hypothetical protein
MDVGLGLAASHGGDSAKPAGSCPVERWRGRKGGRGGWIRLGWGETDVWGPFRCKVQFKESIGSFCEIVKSSIFTIG